MANVTIPSLSPGRKQSFAARGLHFVESITAGELERVLENYLGSHNVLHLATCADDEARSTTLEYFNDGLTVFILSEGGGKLSNLKALPRVSYTIADPYRPEEDFFSAAGMQAWGTASVFRKNDDPERFRDLYRHSRTAEALRRQNLDSAISAVNFNVITIVPHRINYINYRQGYRKITWEL